MKINVKKIIKFCQEYLEVDKFSDYCFNGLQVAGVEEVGKIVTGVSLSQKLIEQAIKQKAQMIIVHHGLFKNDISVNEMPVVQGFWRDRLKLLLEHNINLAGFHLPLDAHPIIGNNISILKVLGLKKVAPLHVGYIGEFPVYLTVDKFYKLLEEKLNIKNVNSYIIKAGKNKIKRVGIISGGASPEFKLAVAAGADAYICGDVREEIVRAVEEAQIHFINAGHYNTEVFGVRSLGNLIAKKFKLPVDFIDIKNKI